MHQNLIRRRRQAIPTDFSGVVVYLKETLRPGDVGGLILVVGGVLLIVAGS